MRRHLNLCVILLFSGISCITSCSGPPPPVTDCDSFIENLRHSKTDIDVTHTEPVIITYAELYVSAHYQAHEYARGEGSCTIDPEYLDAELKRLKDIEEQIDMIQPTGTFVKINEAMVQVREYNSEASAEIDAAYIKLTDDLSLTIPTDKGDIYFTPPTLIYECSFLQKGQDNRGLYKYGIFIFQREKGN